MLLKKTTRVNECRVNVVIYRSPNCRLMSHLGGSHCLKRQSFGIIEGPQVLAVSIQENVICLFRWPLNKAEARHLGSQTIAFTLRIGYHLPLEFFIGKLSLTNYSIQLFFFLLLHGNAVELIVFVNPLFSISFPNFIRKRKILIAILHNIWSNSRNLLINEPTIGLNFQIKTFIISIKFCF